MEVDENKVEAKVHTRGLTHSDFDHAAIKPKPWNLMILEGSAKFYAHHWPLDETGRVFRDWATLTSDRMTFLVTSVTDIKREMYDLKVSKAPLTVTLKGGYIGSTSCNSKSTVLTESGLELMSSVDQIVSIDRLTRRPLQLPDWWKQKYAESAKLSQPLKLNKIQKPEKLSFYDVKVAQSDLDRNNHTTWNAYVRFAFDAMFHFSKTGYLPSLPNFDQYCVQRMELLYNGESFDDDVLHAFAWEDNSQTLTVIVHINKDDTFLFQGRFTFFESN